MATIDTGFSVLPSGAGDLIRNGQWGIDATLTGFIILTEDVSEERILDITQDQKGQVVSQLDYDKHYTLTLNVIGSGTLPTVGDISFSYTPSGMTAMTWKVMSVTYNGSYADKKKYTITCERYNSFPA